MYGPDYTRVVMSGAGTSTHTNFQKDNYDWFYTVFTPLSDFSIRFENQLFIGLHWEESEKIVYPLTVLDTVDTDRVGGLPRANGALSESQVALLKE
jgi:hypothetical protein